MLHTKRTLPLYLQKSPEEKQALSPHDRKLIVFLEEVIDSISEDLYWKLFSSLIMLENEALWEAGALFHRVSV